MGAKSAPLILKIIMSSTWENNQVSIEFSGSDTATLFEVLVCTLTLKNRKFRKIFFITFLLDNLQENEPTT
ncbi:MAG: hypothetical protein Ct9H300mP18_07450 [Candidatus Neomarinimicrobiota bacterium]|nr:MAG: hypothetical protein Ct9H300mP18_07450 [Candidatus Neomarinimicrobiota bacterium]